MKRIIFSRIYSAIGLCLLSTLLTLSFQPLSAQTTQEPVAPLVFSVERGFHEQPFQLEISTLTPGATIHYTLDGSTPSEGAGTLYTGPIAIHKTTLVRAMAYQTDFLPTAVDTHSYLFLDDIITQYADGTPPTDWPTSSVNGQIFNYGMDPDITSRYTPQEMKDALLAISTVSIVTDLEHLFDPTTGIFVNAEEHGRTWERPTSVELIHPDGSEGFQINAGLRMRGGYSRRDANPKHAFRLFFRGEYGATKLRYPFFGDEGSDELNNLDLRTAQNYSWSYAGSSVNAQNTFLREVFSRDTQRDLGRPYTRSRYHHLYVNGVYWGLFMSQERAEASFAETYLGGSTEEYDVVKSAGRVTPIGQAIGEFDYDTEATDGELDGAWRDLWLLSQAQYGAPTLERYMQMQGLNPDGTPNPALPVLLDRENLIDYMLTIFYAGNFDAPLSAFLNGASNNWNGIRNRTTNSHGFQFFSQDAEHSMGAVSGTRNGENRVGPFTQWQQAHFDKSNPQYLHQDLLGTEEYRIHFADQVHRHFFNGGVFTPDQVLARIEPRRQVVEQVIIAESARWGDAKRSDPRDKEDWDAAVASMLGFVNTRSDVVLQQLKDAGLYPNIDAPSFNQHGGEVPNGFDLTIAAPQGTIYYTTDGSDPRQIGGSVNGNATIYAGGETISRSSLVKARVFHNGEWSALNQAEFFVRRGVPATASTLTISEVHYNPDGSDAYEFIEFQNSGIEEIDLSNVVLSSGVYFTFPIGLSLLPNDYIVVVEDEAQFRSRYQDITSPWYHPITVAGQWKDRLRNEGEEIAVMAEDGSEILRFVYNDNGSWPGRADGKGSAMEIKKPSEVPTIQPEKNEHLAIGTRWQPTSEYHGTPGRAGAGPDNRVVVNEVLAQSNPPLLDSIELANRTAESIDISGWFLSDNNSDYKKYQIPAGTILPANGYITFDESDFNDAENPNNRVPFALNSTKGDDIYLLEGDGSDNLLRFVDRVEFSASASGESFGRWPDVLGSLYPMRANTLGQPNDTDANQVRVGEMVISEIHYNPSGSDTNLEFIELYNSGRKTEKLVNWRLRGEVDYDFGPERTLAAGHALLIVGFDPADEALLTAFRTVYSLDDTMPILGPWMDNGLVGFKLDNGGAMLKLLRPSELITPTNGRAPFYPMLIEDTLAYDDEAPWPDTPDGDGPSLERANHTFYGDDAVNWIASQDVGGTPGKVAPIHISGDVNCDGRVTAVDGSFVLQYDVSLRGTGSHCPLAVGSLYTPVCDISGDSACSIWDGVLILKCDVGLPNVFCPAVGVAEIAEPEQVAVEGEAMVEIGIIPAGTVGSVSVPISVDLAGHTLGVLSAKVSYDSTLLQIIDCVVDPQEYFDVGHCNPAFDSGQVGTGAVRFNAISLEGLSGQVGLATLTFDIIGELTEDVLLTFDGIEFANGAEERIPLAIGSVENVVQVDEQSTRSKAIFLPFIQR